MLKKSILSILLLFSFELSGAAPAAKDTLSKAIRMIQRGENDSLRYAANRFLTDTFLKVITTDTSFSASFNQFNNISIVVTPDKKVRIFTWIVPHYNGEKYAYFGYIQWRDEKKHLFQTIELKDSTETTEKPESAKLSPTKWFGAIYYSIIANEVKNKTIYTLIGWKGKNNRVTQKVLDVFSLDKGTITFGKPIFKTQSVYRSRMIYSFASQASMTLRYEENQGRIVVEHITGSGDDNTAFLNGPDGTYDAFVLKKGKWLLLQNVDVDAKSRKPAVKEPAKDEELFKK